MAESDASVDPEAPPHEDDDEDSEDEDEEEEEQGDAPPYRMSPWEAAIAKYKPKTRYFHFIPGTQIKVFYDTLFNPFLPINIRPRSSWSTIFKDKEVDVTPDLLKSVKNHENRANSEFETDFFADIPDSKMPAKRKRESEEETLSIPESVDDNKPLGIEYYPNMWECLGRPDPKKIRTQYLLYEADSAQKACNQYREQINDSYLHFHVREAARIMCKRYDTMLSLCLQEIHLRRQRGTVIPELPANVGDDDSDEESVLSESVHSVHNDDTSVHLEDV